jgi:O-antigen ligase
MSDRTSSLLLGCEQRSDRRVIQEENGRGAVAVLRASRGAILPAAVLAAAVYWGSNDGGIATSRWPAEGILLLLLTAVGAAFGAMRAQVPRLVHVAVACLAAFTIWSYASIAWADIRADAWDGANKTLVYLVCVAAVAYSTSRSLPLVALLVAFGVAVAILGIVQFALAAHGSDPTSYFVAGRLAAPTGYQNANAAFFLMALWPVLLTAIRREAPLAVRAVLFACAAALLELALLSQSRGSLVALPIAFVVVLLLVRYRIRLVLLALIPLAATAAAAPRLLDVYTVVVSGEDPSITLRKALAALLLTAVAAGLVGGVLAIVDRGVTPRRQVVRATGIGLATLAVAGVCTLAVLAATHDASGRLSRGWAQFTHNEIPAPGTTHLSVNLGSNRYDFWRVAWHLFTDHPVGGVGADNYWSYYLRHRQSGEEPRYPHSLELRTISQTGIVGAALFLGAIVPALVVALRRRRRLDPASELLSTSALAMFAYWLVHGSVDWFWEIPALTAPALAALAAAARAGARDTTARDPLQRPAVRAALAGVAVLGVATLAFPWLAARNVELAAESWGTSPATAFSQLDLARRLNPLSDSADVFAGAIHARRNEWSSARRSFAAATRRNPVNWYSHLELAIADVQLRNLDAARVELARARALDPAEPVLAIVAAGIADPEGFDPRAADDALLARAQARVSG